MRCLPVVLVLAACAGATDKDPDDTSSTDEPIDTGTVDACLDPSTLAAGGEEIDCTASGQLCDAAAIACVDPWLYGAPTFDACADGPHTTPESLSDKATTYDTRASTLHVHPDLGWMMGGRIRDGVDPNTAVYTDVVAWSSGENDGLWSSLYLASQAFRYDATTGDEREAARTMIRTLLEAEEERMGVSGMPGNFVRQYVKPGIDGLACPQDDAAYISSDDKTNNRWIKVREDGCLTWLPEEGGETWVVSEVCPGTDYAGWCFLDNTSKDEYAGHMFALGAVLKLVDDEPSRAIAGRLVGEVVDSLLDHDLWMYDPDGRHTEHGDFSPILGLGFNAAFTLGFVTIAAESLPDERYAIARDCFVGRRFDDACPDIEPEILENYQDYLDRNGVILDANGCASNDNVASMFLLALVDLIWWETDPTLKATYQATLAEIWDNSTLRALSKRENAWYDVIWAAFKPLGPDTDGPASAFVTRATCGLATFPADEQRREVPASDNEQLCLDRLDRPMGSVPRGPHERCLESFVWWKDQYILRGCEARPQVVEPPADYLLPYWMGRSFGFIDPTW